MKTNNQPKKVTVKFCTPVTVLITRSGEDGSTTKTVKKIAIINGDWQYYVCKNGLIIYTAYWFEPSVKSQTKIGIKFSTLNVEKITMEY